MGLYQPRATTSVWREGWAFDTVAFAYEVHPLAIIFPPHLPFLPSPSPSTLVRSATILPHLPRWSLPKFHVLKDPSTRYLLGQRWLETFASHPFITSTTAWRRWRVMWRNSMMVSLCGHVLNVPSIWFLDAVLTILIFLYPPSLYPDITQLPTRGPCSKYEISLEEESSVESWS